MPKETHYLNNSPGFQPSVEAFRNCRPETDDQLLTREYVRQRVKESPAYARVVLDMVFEAWTTTSDTVTYEPVKSDAVKKKEALAATIRSFWRNSRWALRRRGPTYAPPEVAYTEACDYLQELERRQASTQDQTPVQPDAGPAVDTAQSVARTRILDSQIESRERAVEHERPTQTVEDHVAGLGQEVPYEEGELRDEPNPLHWVEAAQETGLPDRRETTIQRVVRNTKLAQTVKELHHHQCQVCGLRLEIPEGAYSESAHIRPLGHPHDGPDEIQNILCLCPNHHVLFDGGALIITSELVVVDALTGDPIGRLRTAPNHWLEPDHLAYRRHMHGSSLT